MDITPRVIERVDQALTDLESSLTDSLGLTFLWMVDLQARAFLPRGYDPLLPGLSGPISFGHPALEVHEEPRRLSELKTVERERWERELGISYFFSLHRDDYGIFGLSEKKSQLQIELSEIPTRHSPIDDLTEGERELFTLIKDGRTNEAIAEALGVSLATVKKRNSGLFKQLGVSSRAEALKRI